MLPNLLFNIWCVSIFVTTMNRGKKIHTDTSKSVYIEWHIPSFVFMFLSHSVWLNSIEMEWRVLIFTWNSYSLEWHLKNEISTYTKNMTQMKNVILFFLPKTTVPVFFCFLFWYTHIRIFQTIAMCIAQYLRETM